MFICNRDVGCICASVHNNSKMHLLTRQCARLQWHKISTMRTRAYTLSKMIFCNELKLYVTRASALVLLCPVVTLQRKALLASEKRPQRRSRLPLPAQACNYLQLQATHEVSALSQKNCKSEPWLAGYQCFDLHDSAKRLTTLSTANRILANPSMEKLCAY